MLQLYVTASSLLVGRESLSQTTTRGRVQTSLRLTVEPRRVGIRLTNLSTLEGYRAIIS